MHSEDGEEERHVEASGWMIALQERPDDGTVIRDFDAWRKDPDNDAAWQELKRTNDLIRDASRTLVRTRPHFAGRRRAFLQRMPVPAICLGFLAAALMLGDLVPNLGADFRTGGAEIRHVRLDDGSKVILAPHSAVSIDPDDPRSLTLVKGRALFEVVHDADRPFRVVSGQAVATDLGTIFEVRADGRITMIGVQEGLVEVSCANESVDSSELHPGEMTTVDCEAGFARRNVRPSMAIGSWAKGRLVVQDQTLEDVLQELRPWRSGVLFGRGAGMTRRVTGVYDLRNPDAALNALARSHDASILRITPWITIVDAR